MEFNKLPQEIRLKMLVRQSEAQGYSDGSVFEKNIEAWSAGGGFDWSETVEGHSFWSDILTIGLFDVFYDKYPKEKFSMKSLKKGDKVYHNKSGEIFTVETNDCLNGRVTVSGSCSFRGLSWAEVSVFDSIPYLNHCRKNNIQIDWDNFFPEFILGEWEWERDHDKFTKEDAVNHPSHYKEFSVETIDMMERIWGAHSLRMYCEINAFKYKMRAGAKIGQPADRDLSKAQWYLNKANSILEKMKSREGEHKQAKL